MRERREEKVDRFAFLGVHKSTITNESCRQDDHVVKLSSKLVNQTFAHTCGKCMYKLIYTAIVLTSGAGCVNSDSVYCTGHV